MLELPIDTLKEPDNDVLTSDLCNKEQGLYTLCVDLNNLEEFNDDWYRIMYNNYNKRQGDSFIAWLEDICIT